MSTDRESSSSASEPFVGRRATDRTPLARITGQIEYAYDNGDCARAAALIERDPIAAWFGIEPARFSRIVADFMQHEEARGLFVRTVGLLLMAQPEVAVPGGSVRAGGYGGDLGLGRGVGDGVELRGSSDAGVDAESLRELAARAEEQRFPVRSAVLIGRILQLRHAGRPVQALHMAGELGEHFGLMQAEYEGGLGWGLLSAVQYGITAMLAGEFGTALVSFAQARMHADVPALSFLKRNACLKSAVIEALYGSADRAAALLDEAERIPRSESWVEGVNDAARIIAQSRVRAQSPQESLRLLETVPLGDLGEMWPFHVLALQRAWSMAGSAQNAVRSVARFEQLPLARVDGEGLTGSALHVASALNSVLIGDIAEALARLDLADDSIVLTQVTRAVAELLSGRPREARQRASELHERTQDLRLLEVQRLAIIASSCHALGDEAECEKVLGFANAMPGGVSQYEATFFPLEVRTIAERGFDEWPRSGESPYLTQEGFSMHREVLTDRELQMLHGLAEGHSREEIAKAEFISMNTLKTHLRSLYRKLGVRSRSAAVLEGERRGLL